MMTMTTSSSRRVKPLAAPERPGAQGSEPDRTVRGDEKWPTLPAVMAIPLFRLPVVQRLENEWFDLLRG
jgi:hypothetical protein